LLAITTHGLLLLGDSYLRPGLAGIAVPFVIAAKPLWTGLGIIGGWLAAILGLSFYLRRWIGTRTWRWMHRWTVLVYALAVAHTLGSGTDARSPWLLAIIGATGVPIVFLATHRFLPATRRRNAPGHSSRRAGDGQRLASRGAPSEPSVASQSL
jgi:predicted ferric reductase